MSGHKACNFGFFKLFFHELINGMPLEMLFYIHLGYESYHMIVEVQIKNS